MQTYIKTVNYTNQTLIHLAPVELSIIKHTYILLITLESCFLLKCLNPSDTTNTPDTMRIFNNDLRTTDSYLHKEMVPIVLEMLHALHYQEKIRKLAYLVRTYCNVSKKIYKRCTLNLSPNLYGHVKLCLFKYHNYFSHLFKCRSTLQNNYIQQLIMMFEMLTDGFVKLIRSFERIACIQTTLLIYKTVITSSAPGLNLLNHHQPFVVSMYILSQCSQKNDHNLG